MSNGRRQPSRGGTSRMTRECQVRFCERLGVQFPGPSTRAEDPRNVAKCQGLNRSRGRALRQPAWPTAIAGRGALS